MDEATEVLQREPMLRKVIDDGDKLKVVSEFVQWLREEKGLEICQLTHVSYTDKKVYVRSAEKPEWLIAEFFKVDLRKLDMELKRYGHIDELSSMTGDDVIRMHGQNMIERLNVLSAAIRKATPK